MISSPPCQWSGVESKLRFCSPQNVSGASQHSSAAASPKQLKWKGTWFKMNKYKSWATPVSNLRLLVSILSGVSFQGRPGQVHHTRGVHPHDKGHHHGNSQGSGCRQLRSAGGRDRHCQPEPQSHLRYADCLQGANPHCPARTGLTQTSPGCQGTCEVGLQRADRTLESSLLYGCSRW